MTLWTLSREEFVLIPGEENLNAGEASNDQSILRDVSKLSRIEMKAIRMILSCR